MKKLLLLSSLLALMVPCVSSAQDSIEQCYKSATTTSAVRECLKKAGLLTRDDRTVERKKYGRAKARRSYQFSKR